MVGFGTLVSPEFNTALAAGPNFQSQKNEVKDKRSDLQSEMESKQSELDKLIAEQEAVQAEIKRLDFAVGETKAEIREKEAQIEEARLEIERLKAEIVVTKERIAKRDELLKNRMKSIQESGGVISYLDVILGAQSFTDFLNRVNAVSSFVQADQDIIKAHVADKELLENTEAEVIRNLAGLEENLAELEGMIKKLNSQMAEQAKIKKQLQKQEEEVHAEYAELENADAVLAAQAKAIAAAEAKWKKEQASGQMPTITNGTFMNPTTGRLTSNYGTRWGRLHSGIDIGKGGRSGDVPVVAAASGTVIRAGYDNSYGNVVMISHYIDGQVMTTVYGHHESLFVREGQHVEKGTLLGYMGNTGHSFGAHLHFEIHHGPWNGSRSNSVNPLKYVNY